MEDFDKQKQPFDEIKFGQTVNPVRKVTMPTLKIEGCQGEEVLTESEFRIMLILKKARGNIITRQDILDILYGEPAGDLPLSNIEDKFIKGLRLKLEKASLPSSRFSIRNQTSVGWYLFDTQHPKSSYGEVGKGTRDVTYRLKDRNDKQ